MQARLDADWADRSLPWVLAAGLFAILLAMSFAVIRQLDGGPGLAIWVQSAFRYRHGHSAVSSLAGVNPAANQWAFVAYPVLWLSRWVPSAQLFAAIQALALALGVVPLWRLARNVFDLRVGTTVAVIGAYALAPAVHAVNLSMFHPEAIAVPAFAGAALYRRQGKWIPYAACILVMLASRADLGITVAALGIVVILDGDRLAGALTVVAGALWTAAAVVVLDPKVPTGPLTAGRAYAAQGIAPLAEARQLFTDPTEVIGHLTGQQSIVVVIALFGPLLFLGFAAPRTLIPAVPAFVLGIASSQAIEAASEPGVPHGALGAGRVIVAVVPITVAGLVALSRVGDRSVTRVNVDHRLVAAVVVASLLLFVENAPSSPYQQPWAWGGRDRVDAARQAAVEEVPPTASVTVSPQLSALVAERHVALEMWLGPPDDPDVWRPTTERVLVDTTALDDTDAPLWEPEDGDALVHSLERQGYVVVSSSEGIVSLRR